MRWLYFLYTKQSTKREGEKKQKNKLAYSLMNNFDTLCKHLGQKMITKPNYIFKNMNEHIYV